jgi:hypothetical protein
MGLHITFWGSILGNFYKIKVGAAIGRLHSSFGFFSIPILKRISYLVWSSTTRQASFWRHFCSLDIFWGHILVARDKLSGL